MARTIVRGARVFDGRATLPPRDVLIEGTRVVRVEPSIDVGDAEELDGSGMTLLPGLIDAHTHVFGDALTEALTFGVTTEIDMFTEVSQARAWHEEQDRGEATARADIHSAGHPATARGGHGTQYGIPIATLSRPEEAEAFVRDRLSEGSRFLKIIWERGDGTWPTLDEPTMAALAAAARAAGIVSVIHVSRQHDARRAIELGVHGLAHVFRDEEPGPDLGEVFARAGAFVIPTLSVIMGASGVAEGAELTTHPIFRPLLTPAQERSLRTADRDPKPEKSRHAMSAVTALHRAGVPILAGTDAANAGTAHGPSLHKEIELLVRCGMTPTQALAAATSVPASVFGLDGRGVIEPGARADLLLVRGDPSQDVRRTREIVAVWKEGRRFDHQAREGVVREIRARDEAPAPVPEIGDGTISDFEDGLSARFGLGWTSTSDARMGGTSSATLAVTEGGAAGTGRCLAVEGEVTSDHLFPWAGAAFEPGSVPMEAVDLSATRGVELWLRGDGGTYKLGVRTKRDGWVPVTTDVRTTEEWARHTVLFSDLGIDASGVTGISLTCIERRPFWFQIDEVRLA